MSDPLSPVREHYKDQLLDVCFHYMGQDLRAKLMVECPMAYNAYCGREVVEVVRTSDRAQMTHHGPREFNLVHGGGDDNKPNGGAA